LRIPVGPPYQKISEIETNEFGLPVKEYYSTGEVCQVLGIKLDTFRFRLRKGYYPESERVGGKRRFTLSHIKNIIEMRNALLKDKSL